MKKTRTIWLSFLSSNVQCLIRKDPQVKIQADNELSNLSSTPPSIPPMTYLTETILINTLPATAMPAASVPDEANQNIRNNNEVPKKRWIAG